MCCGEKTNCEVNVELWDNYYECMSECKQTIGGFDLSWWCNEKLECLWNLIKKISVLIGEKLL